MKKVFEKSIRRLTEFVIASFIINLLVHIFSITTRRALESWIIMTNDATAERDHAALSLTKHRF